MRPIYLLNCLLLRSKTYIVEGKQMHAVSLGMTAVMENEAE